MVRPIRLIIAAVLTAFVATPVFPGTTAEPAPRPAVLPGAPATHIPQTYVLVHGAWAGGWEWKKVGGLLQQQGHTVYRPTLTGQGERIHLASKEVDLNTHIQDIVNVILFEDLHDVVLMGHSYGGMVVTGVADRIPDRIKCLVYVDAFLPEDGESVQALGGRKLTEVDGFISAPGNAPATQPQPPYLAPMSAKIFATPEVLKNPAARKIPAVYILCVNPKMGVEKAAFHRFYLRAQQRGYFTETIESNHVVNQSHPLQLLPLLEKAPNDAKCDTSVP